jgi:hypothetical protein
VAPLNTGKSETNGARHTGSHQIWWKHRCYS